MFKGRKNYRLLGICGSKMANEDVKNTVDSICRVATEHGWKVMLFMSFSDLFNKNGETAGEAGIFKLVNAELLDALIILPQAIQNDDVCRMIIGYAEIAGIPAITIDKKLPDTPCIRFDYLSTFEQIVRHIVEYHGCRRVNFIAGFKGNEFSEARIECYKRILAENDIPFDENRLGYGDFWEAPTIQVMDKFMNSGLPLPEAIICCNDSMAITACQYLYHHNIKVPDDVIVTGFDGIELEKYYQPRLTTASIDFSAIGSAAVALVENMINGKSTTEDTTIPYKMHIAQSCGCKGIDSVNPCDKILKLYDRVGNAEWHEDFMFSYVRKATACSTLSDVAKIMKKYGDYCEWFCINTDIFDEKPDERRFHDVFTENVNAFMIRDFDELNSDGVIFPVRGLLPDMESVLEKHDILFFSPIHFVEDVLGYTCAAISYAEESIYANRRRYISDTTQILENLINRTRLERVNSELAEMHVHDPLTGLLNRRGFYKKFAKLKGGTFYVFSLDMDGLKYINDNFGHSEGDSAIKTVANALMSVSAESTVCSRFGGDEFAVIGGGENFSPEKYIRDVREYLAEYNKNSGKPYPVGISCGWETANIISGCDIDEIIKTADARMYEDKRSRKAGRDQIGK